MKTRSEGSVGHFAATGQRSLTDPGSVGLFFGRHPATRQEGDSPEQGTERGTGMKRRQGCAGLLLAVLSLPVLAAVGAPEQEELRLGFI